MRLPWSSWIVLEQLITYWLGIGGFVFIWICGGSSKEEAHVRSWGLWSRYCCLPSGPWLSSPGFQLWDNPLRHMRYVIELRLSKPCIKMAALILIDQSPGQVLRGTLCVWILLRTMNRSTSLCCSLSLQSSHNVMFSFTRRAWWLIGQNQEFGITLYISISEHFFFKLKIPGLACKELWPGSGVLCLSKQIAARGEETWFLGSVPLISR